MAQTWREVIDTEKDNSKSLTVTFRAFGNVVFDIGGKGR